MAGTAVVRTENGTFGIDLESELVLEEPPSPAAPDEPRVELPRVIAAAQAGSTIVAVVAHRPPLAVSHDAGRTWREAGRGLPDGRAVAIDADDPDRILFAARNRLYLSEDGGRFWRALALELPAIAAVAFA